MSSSTIIINNNINRVAEKLDPGTQLGLVKWFNLKKGWGFITPLDFEAVGGDVFVYQAVIEMRGFRKLWPSQLVQFEFRKSSKGLEATRVVPVSPTASEANQSRPRSEEAKDPTAMLELDFGKIFGLNQVSNGHSNPRWPPPRDKLIKCFNCGKFGHHKAVNCRIDSQNFDTNFESKRCHRCRSDQHLLADCPGQPTDQFFTIRIKNSEPKPQAPKPTTRPIYLKKSLK